MADYQKPIPQASPETAFFWAGCKEGKLLLQRCKDTGKAYFPPRPFSPYTGSRDVEVFEASGKAKLFSYVINHRPPKLKCPAGALRRPTGPVVAQHRARSERGRAGT